MSTQDTLKVGDIITIKAKPEHLLVVRSERYVSPAYDGSYWVDEMDCVEIAKDRWGRPVQTVQYEAPKVIRYHFEGGCMRGKGKLIKDTDVRVVGHAQLTTYSTVTHVMEEIRYYG